MSSVTDSNAARLAKLKDAQGEGPNELRSLRASMARTIRSATLAVVLPLWYRIAASYDERVRAAYLWCNGGYARRRERDWRDLGRGR